MMRSLLIAAILAAGLYVADQQFAAGKYADAIARMAAQMRHSFGY